MKNRRINKEIQKILNNMYEYLYNVWEEEKNYEKGRLSIQRIAEYYRQIDREIIMYETLIGKETWKEIYKKQKY